MNALDAIVDTRHPTKTAIAEWAAATLGRDDMVARDRDSVFDHDGWQACAARGILGVGIAPEHGGTGGGWVDVALTLEGLGLGCRDNGLAFALGSERLSAFDALERFGTADQIAHVLVPALRGERIIAFAITEPTSGSDTYAMAARAERDRDGWVLHGHKAHITLAPVADAAIVFASTDPAAGRWGISAFVVHRDRSGVEFRENREKMGLRTTPYGDIVLDGYRAGAGDLLGREGAGASIFATSMESERALIMATHLGAAERTIAQAIDRANTRSQFGRPIATFQAVSHRLVDMQVAHETARLLLYKAAAVMDRGGRATMAAATAKLGVAEALSALALDAARIHGALGYETTHEVEREVRDALGGLVYSGTSDIQKNLIASLMGVAVEQRKANP